MKGDKIFDKCFNKISEEKQVKSNKLSTKEKENSFSFLHFEQNMASENLYLNNNNIIKDIYLYIYILINNNKRKYSLKKKEKGNKEIMRLESILYGRKIIYFLLLSLFYKAGLKNIYHEKFILNANEITLKVNGKGMHNILSQAGFDEKHTIQCPSKIYINNTEITIPSPCYKINIDSADSIIKLEWNESLKCTSWLFAACDTIKEIDLTNFDASLVTNMLNMFDDCIALTSINLSNLDTSNVKNMGSMFDGLLSLTSLNLKNFDTRNLENLGYMFYKSNSLISIDLSNFDTSKVSFFECMFKDCEKLEYINLKNFEEIPNPKTTDVFTNIAKNAVICLNSTKAPILYDMANEMECVVISCEEDWRSVQKKIIFEENNCVDNCSLTENNK